MTPSRLYGACLVTPFALFPSPTQDSSHTGQPLIRWALPLQVSVATWANVGGNWVAVGVLER